MARNEVVKVACEDCGGGDRNHRVVQEHKERWGEDEIQGGDTYQIVQCQGCESIRFRIESWDSESWNPATDEYESKVRIYPEHVAGKRKAIADEYDDVPIEVQRIYRETITALNSGALILTAAGLRAIVEAICLNAEVPGANLQKRIDGLVEKKLLAEAQAELLHEERYLGNAALHEIEPPARKHIEDGLTIVESLLNTMYIARANADRLRQARLKKKAAKARAAAPPPGAKGSS